MKNFLRLLVIFAFFSFTSIFAKGNNIQSSHFAISLGMANITAHEYSWNESEKLSELEWKANAVPFLSAEYESDFFNFARSINKFYYGFGNGKRMIDDDWLNGINTNTGKVSPTRNPNIHTHRSIHDDLKLKQMLGFDFALKSYPITLLNDFNASFGGGLKIDYVEFDAKGGEYFYGCKDGYPNGCADIGQFTPGKSVITYSQNFLTPYVSVWFDYKIDDFFTNLNIKYSPLVYARDYDEHHLRDIVFETEITNMKYFGGIFSLGMNVDSNFSFGFSVEYEKYYDKRGDIYISGAEGNWVSPNSSSFDNTTIKTMIFGKYTF